MSPRLVLLRSQSDERLVGLARAGNERAFVAIVERYRPELHALARRLCSDGRSEDVVQQAFLSAFVALSAGSEVRHLRGWLYQIVRNAAHRPSAPLCVPLDRAEATVSSAEDVVQERALAMATLSELARLPDRQRQAMIGTALDGRARAELASSMGLSEGAVRQLVHRARTALRSVVTAVTPWPVARWIAAVRPDAPGTAELAAGAGAASSGGLAIKLGALLASGTLLTGAAIDLRAPFHRDGGRAAIAARPRPHVPRAPGAAAASPAHGVSVDLVSARARVTEVVAGEGGLAGHVGRDAVYIRSRSSRRDAGSRRSVGRDGGQTAGRHDGAGGRRDGAKTGRGGNDGSSHSNYWSGGGQGRDGGQSPGDRGAGSGRRLGSGDQVDGASGADAGGSGDRGQSGGSGSGDVGGSPSGPGVGSSGD